MAQEDPEPTLSTLDYNAPYPPGCLVHVRHVHPETNKTTLRKLFAKASSEDDAGIDYVDFNKGMITVRAIVSIRWRYRFIDHLFL